MSIVKAILLTLVFTTGVVSAQYLQKIGLYGYPKPPDGIKYKEYLVAGSLTDLVVYKHQDNDYVLQTSYRVGSKDLNRDYVASVVAHGDKIYAMTWYGHLIVCQYGAKGTIDSVITTRLNAYRLFSTPYGPVVNIDTSLYEMLYDGELKLHKIDSDDSYDLRYAVADGNYLYAVADWQKGSLYYHSDGHYRKVNTFKIDGELCLYTDSLYLYTEFAKYRRNGFELGPEEYFRNENEVLQTSGGIKRGRFHLRVVFIDGLYVCVDENDTLKILEIKAREARTGFTTLAMYGDTVLLFGGTPGIYIYRFDTTQVTGIVKPFPQQPNISLYPMPFEEEIIIESTERYERIKAYSLLGKELDLTVSETPSGYRLHIKNPSAQTILRMDGKDGRVYSRMVLRK